MNLPASAGDVVSIPGLGRSPGGGNGNPFRNSCLGNPMDRRNWRATVHGVIKSQPWLSMHACSLLTAPHCLGLGNSSLSPLLFYTFIYFCAGSLLLVGFSLVAVTSCVSLVVVCGLLIEMASCCGAWTVGRMGFSSCSTWALEHRLKDCGLSCSAAYGIFPDQGSSPYLLHWQAGSLPLSHQGNPHLSP